MRPCRRSFDVSGSPSPLVPAPSVPREEGMGWKDAPCPGGDGGRVVGPGRIAAGPALVLSLGGRTPVARPTTFPNPLANGIFPVISGIVGSFMNDPPPSLFQ